ncbi:MAG: bifunctional phosphopantothenoylcysteine decarboxylase/phosphopantothenate--cysteine ligase CoaBC, partial [Proteobacteria bacterium]|nr:bifunctional phosphopantothenoylcysteine decarboxylase/phosphopantothenate--cysteine ligase CoaBC [Pseudomonadota bacterium]
MTFPADRGAALPDPVPALAGQRVLLVITGGIAAYKSLDLIRRLRDAGARVRCILTKGGREFVTPLSVAALSGEPVHEDLFSVTAEVEMGHIRLSRESDLIVVAPATADFLAKMAQGRADDLATAAVLAATVPVLVAPSMNAAMWANAATRRNVATLAADGIAFAGPADGDLACGEVGPGRMVEPAALLLAIRIRLARDFGQSLAGRRALVTSGPTREAIDPVRFLGNVSSGKQGHAIAAALARR